MSFGTNAVWCVGSSNIVMRILQHTWHSLCLQGVRVCLISLLIGLSRACTSGGRSASGEGSIHTDPSCAWSVFWPMAYMGQTFGSPKSVTRIVYYYLATRGLNSKRSQLFSPISSGNVTFSHQLGHSCYFTVSLFLHSAPPEIITPLWSLVEANILTASC